MKNSKTLIFDKKGFEPEIQFTNFLIKNKIKNFVIFEKTKKYVTVVY